MYVITIGSQRAETRTTLAGVLEYLNRDRAGRTAPRVEDIAVRHIERGHIPVIRLKSGTLAVRPAGTARSILTMILDEVDRYIVRVAGKVLQPYEMSRSAWGAVVAAGHLAYCPEEAIDMSQADAGPLFHTVDLFEEKGPFDIEAFVRGEFQRRFGFATNGPLYDRAAVPNSRHEVHVAYALLRGDKVRDCVLNTYRDNPEFGKHDLSWMRTLIEVPALRGALPTRQLEALCQIMGFAKQPITPSNAGRLVTIVRRLPADCTDVHIDDALFEAGILPPRTSPVLKAPEGEAARPVSDLAACIFDLITQRRFNERMDKSKAERDAYRITQREFDHEARMAVAERISYGYSWPNRVALVVLQRDITAMLSIFDGPKDWNTDSKRAIRDVLGVDLLQCTAAVRRRRIFEMCGFSTEEQQRWEQHAAAAKAERTALREFEDAKERAEASSWCVDGGRVMNGREYVDYCIAEGFSEIVDMPRGNTREYRIRDPRRGYSRRLRAKDGTLSYARARLAQVSPPIAMAA